MKTNKKLTLYKGYYSGIYFTYNNIDGKIVNEKQITKEQYDKS